jgi:lysophospholipase L1-like esterase
MSASGSPLTEPPRGPRARRLHPRLHPRRRRLAGLAALGLAVAGVSTGVPSPASAAAFPGGYVAMGDSYTSGPGIATQRPGTGVCARSDHNYPSLVAAAVQPTSFRDVSCSGATTAGITGTQAGQPPQLDAVDSTTRLVTIGIGGNDAGLIGAGTTCVFLALFDGQGAPCTAVYTYTGTDTLRQSIAAAQPTIRATIQAVKQRAPQARILLVGYPNLLPPTKAQCDPSVDDNAIADGDVPWLHGINVEVNRAWAATAAAAGVEYVDTFTPGQGHDTCQRVGVRWVEGVANLTNGAPIHPNGDGMAAFARLVVAKLG